MNVDLPGRNLEVPDHLCCVAASVSIVSDVVQGRNDLGKQRIRSSRKRVIDETLLSPKEAMELESRRAYNRVCAARARKKSKNTVANLQDEVTTLTSEKATLQKESTVLKAQLDVLEQQNQALMIQHASWTQTRRTQGSILNVGMGIPRTSFATVGPSLSDVCALRGSLNVSDSSMLRYLHRQIN